MASGHSLPGVVTLKEARHIVELHAESALRGAREHPTETVDLLAARGRVLAETIIADRDFPPFHRATRDGYALKAIDVARVPARLKVVGEIKAGDSQGGVFGSTALRSGETVSIMTGAPLPMGADAVVMVEDTAAIELPLSSEADSPNTSGGGAERLAEIRRSVRAGENFVPCGAEARAGHVLIDKGRRIDPALIGIAASVGWGRVKVHPRPRVAVLATGNEVVEMDTVPAAAQIRNSNSYSLAAQIEEAGGEAVRLQIAPDERKRLRELIEEGLGYDLLLITGGVSMGKYDLVEVVLEEMKAEFHFTGALIQPGKPVVFGTCNAGSQGKHFFGLPGNPVSTMVTFRLFAQPMIAALAGARPEPLVFLKARTKAEVRHKTGLTRFLPAVISGEFEDAEVELAAWQGSGDIAALARTNCYLVVPPDQERIAAKEWVSVLPR